MGVFADYVLLVAWHPLFCADNGIGLSGLLHAVQIGRVVAFHL